MHYTAKPNIITRQFGTKPTAELTLAQTLQSDSTDYLIGVSLVLKNGKIDKFLFDGGYAKATATGTYTDSFAFHYYNKDHLGNNREMVDAKGNVVQVTNYYPFGAPYADVSAVKNADKQSYKYNGKELDTMHGLNTYDHGARQNYSILGRWDRIDPRCEDYYDLSPYVYCGDNPILCVDPDGKAIVPAGTTKLVKGAKVVKSADKASDVAKGVDKVADANHAKELIKKVVLDDKQD